MADPNNREARALMPPSGKIMAGEPASRAHGPPRFSNEIWREIALYLPRRDLRSLLLVSHAMSAIAGQLLFRRVHLQFGTAHHYLKWQDKDSLDTVELDKWHAQRSADILSRLVSDTAYASHVHTFIVSAPASGKNALNAFQIAMLANVLPKLINLEMFGCSMSDHAIGQVFGILEKHHRKLRSLTIDSTASTPPALPNLSNLTHFTYNGIAEEPLDLRNLFIGRNVALHTLVIRNAGRLYPEGLTSLSNLTVLDLSVGFERPELLSDIFAHSAQLQTLRLACTADDDVQLSRCFRAHVATLPALREFMFSLHLAPRGIKDPDLFPAVAEFVRGHPDLVVLALSAGWRSAVGFDAAVWGILPVLAKLHTLQIDVPEDLSPALSAWLIPRTVVALNLILPPKTDSSVLTQLWPGLPRDLKVVVLPLKMSADIQALIGSRLPNLRLLCMAGVYYSVLHTGSGGTQLEAWSQRRTMFSFNDHLEEIDCEEAQAFTTTDHWRW